MTTKPAPALVIAKKKMLSTIAAAQRRAETAKKTAKSAKQDFRQAKQKFKDARKTARKARKDVKALKAELAALSAKKPMRKVAAKKPAPKRVAPVAEIPVLGGIVPAPAEITWPVGTSTPVQ